MFHFWQVHIGYRHSILATLAWQMWVARKMAWWKLYLHINLWILRVTILIGTFIQCRIASLEQLVQCRFRISYGIQPNTFCIWSRLYLSAHLRFFTWSLHFGPVRSEPLQIILDPSIRRQCHGEAPQTRGYMERISCTCISNWVTTWNDWVCSDKASCLVYQLHDRSCSTCISFLSIRVCHH